MKRSPISRVNPGVVLLVLIHLVVGGCASSSNKNFTSLALVGESSTEGTWEYAGAIGEIITTDHFRIHTTVETPALRDRFPEFMEDALERYQQAFGPLPAPEGMLNTYLFGDRPQWLTFTREIMGEKAERYANIRRGGYSTQSRVVLWDLGLYDTLRIAAHEGWHQYTQATFKDRLPAWLEEGIATCMEGHRWSDDDDEPEFESWANPERFFTLRRSHYRRRLIPLEELLTIEPEDLLGGSSRRILGYYAQVWVLIQFLREGEDGKYRAGLTEALQDAASGDLDDAVRTARRVAERMKTGGKDLNRGRLVFYAYFGTDLEVMDDEYRAFIKGLMSRRARESVLRGENPHRP